MAEFKRSRLSRKTDESVTKKTVFFGLLTIIVIFVIIVFGLPFLIRFSVFLGNIKKTDSNNISKEVPPLAPRLVIPFEATTSGSIDISGLAEARVEVELFKDEISVGKTTVTDNGDFSFKNISLEQGDNSFSAIASTKETGSGSASTPLVLIYDNQPPMLNITNPSESSLEIDYADFDIIGETDKGSSVSINGKLASIDDEGKFKLRLQLATGKNDIEIISKDEAGNETKKTVSITYSL